MKLGIMQPYLFPYLGYWQLINYTDEWIFFDVVQYNKKSWMNRNRILHPDKNKDFQYISVPIKKHKNGALIHDVFINNDEQWKDKILGELTVYKNLNAPHYDEVMGLINSILEKEYTDFLSLAIESTKEICQYLGIDFNYKIASEIDFDRSNIHGPGDWALEISKNQNATQYINPPGGYKLFDEDKYSKSGIDLLFLKPKLFNYKQSRREKFIEGLSIIDVMMFNDKSEIKEFLSRNFSLLKKEDLEGENYI